LFKASEAISYDVQMCSDAHSITLINKKAFLSFWFLWYKYQANYFRSRRRNKV